MTFSQEGGGAMSGPQHVMRVPLNVAVARMPASLLAGTTTVVLERLAGRAPRWRWRAAGGGGTIALSALTPDKTGLVLVEDPETPSAVAHALTVELYGALERTWAPAVPRSPGIGVRPKLAVAAVAILVPLLAVAGMRVLAPPKAVDVAAAVEQFREQGSASQAAPAQPPVQERGKARPKADAEDDAGASRQQPAATSSRDNTGRRQNQPPQSGRKNAGGKSGAPSTTTSTAASRDSGRRQQQPKQKDRPREKTASGIPEEGVYRYATEGYESIDRPSSRHDYPSETAMSIRANDCGFTGRWQPLENRWDEMTVCREGGDSFLPRLSTHREFYGQENDSDYRCNDGNYAYRPQPGATWTGTCSDGPAKMDIRGRTIGREVVRVGDEAVETVHYTMQARIYGGDAEGTWVAERWVDPETGVLVRVEAETDATSDSSVGKVRYREELSLRLLSMQPQR